MQDQRKDDRKRGDHHRQRLHEAAEDQVEDHQQQDDLKRSRPDVGDKARQCLRNAQHPDHEVQEVRRHHDQQDHRRDAHGRYHAFMHHRQRKTSFGDGDPKTADDPDGRRFGRRGPAQIDRPHHDQEDHDRRDDIDEARDFLGPGPRGQHRPGKFGPQDADPGDQHHEQPGKDQSRHHTGREKLPDRGIRHRAVDDHVDRGWQQDAQRSPSGDGARGQPGIVAALFHDRHGHRADGGGRCHRRTGNRRKEGACPDVRMQQPARKAPQPIRKAAIKSVRHARAHQDFAQKDEKRDSGQDKVVLSAPHLVAEGKKRRQTQKGPGADECCQKQRDRHRQARQHQAQHHEKADRGSENTDHLAALSMPDSEVRVSSSITSSRVLTP